MRQVRNMSMQGARWNDSVDGNGSADANGTVNSPRSWNLSDHIHLYRQQWELCGSRHPDHQGRGHHPTSDH